MADEIITELWKVKDAIAKEYGCDVKAIVAHLRAKKRGEENSIINLRSMKQIPEQKNAANGEAM
jgi:hypothetical protein